MENKKQNIKDVFIINEENSKEKSRWIKIGVAFTNKDNSLNVTLNSLPLDGKLHIRDRKEK